MKSLILVLVVLLNVEFLASTKYKFDFEAHITIKQNFVLEEEIGFQKTLIPFHFGTAKTNFPQALIYKIAPLNIRKIIYVYSDNKDESYQRKLNSDRNDSLISLFGNRIKKLNHIVLETIIIEKDKLDKTSFNGFIIVSEFSSKANVKILTDLLEETKCKSKEKEGFVFDTLSDYNYILPHVYPHVSSVSLTKKDEANIVNIVMERKRWKNMLVVLDVTGSMSPYIGQYLLWLKLNFDEKKNQSFVFFNDGNHNVKKTIGATGGLYFSKNNLGFEHILKTIKLAMKNGNGGDCPENNIEAVIKGIQRNKTSDIDEVIMIADNWATPRDIGLINKVDKPLRIILCGVYEEKVNLNYLRLARYSGGSVHTMESDLEGLLELKEGEEFTFGGNQYKIKEGEIVLKELY